MAPVLVEVRGRYVDRFDNPVPGTVRFVPSVRGVSSGDNTIVPTTPETVQLAADGTFSVFVQATDDPGYLPTGWTYRVEEMVGNAPQRAYNIDIPASAAGPGIDLADVIPVPPGYGNPDVYVTLTAFNDFVATFDGGTTGQVLKKVSNADGDWSWQADTVGAVDSVDGRTGVVTLGDLYDPLGAAAAAQAAAEAASDPAGTAAAAVAAAAAQSVIITATGVGNYTVPAGAQFLLVEALGAGSGGGSGRRGAAGGIRAGGGGGSGGSKARALLPVAEVLALYPGGIVAYSVGAGGAGGAAQAVDNQNGNNGSAGSPTLFGTNGNLLVARGGNTGGTGGTGGATSGGAASVGEFIGGAGGAASATGGTGSGGAFSGAGIGGSGGGGITAGDSPSNGGAGSTSVMATVTSTGGTAGVVGGASPTSGTAQIPGVPGPGPGGGAASILGAAQAGANGLNNSGAGGAGGGAALNGNNSGAGGTGGSGYLKITALF